MSNKLLGPDVGYVDLFFYQLEEQLKKDNEANKTFQRTPIRPSSAGKCARELYFEMMEYSGKAKYPTEPMSGETHLLLGLGHHIERHLIENMRKHFNLVEIKYTQQVLDFGHIEAINDERLGQHLEGSTDLCLVSKNWKCVADIKSKGDNYDFRARKMKWDADSIKYANMKSVQALSDRSFWVSDLPSFFEELQDPFFEANFRQLNLYLGSKFMQDRDMDHGAIIQYHKTKSKLREVRFRFSKKIYNETIEKFKGIVRAVDEDKIELAPAQYPADSFKSRYCNYCKAKTPGSCAMVNKESKK